MLRGEGVREARLNVHRGENGESSLASPRHDSGPPISSVASVRLSLCTVNIRRNSEDCAPRPGEILRPLNNRNASPEQWRGSVGRGRQPLTDGLTVALRFGRAGEDEHAGCWQDVRNSGGFVRTHEWIWR